MLTIPNKKKQTKWKCPRHCQPNEEHSATHKLNNSLPITRSEMNEWEVTRNQTQGRSKKPHR